MNARHYQGHWRRGQSEISIFFDIYPCNFKGRKELFILYQSDKSGLWIFHWYDFGEKFTIPDNT
jgi:hypothetical protein